MAKKYISLSGKTVNWISKKGKLLDFVNNELLPGYWYY